MRVFFQAFLSSPFFVGSGPPTAFAHDHPPFAFATQSVLPSAESASGGGVPAARDEALRPRRTEVAADVDDGDGVVVGVRDVERPARPGRARARSASSRPGARPPTACRGRPARAPRRSAARRRARRASTAATRLRFDCATKSVRPSRENSEVGGVVGASSRSRRRRRRRRRRATRTRRPSSRRRGASPSGERTGRYGWTPTGDRRRHRARREVDPDDVVQEDARGPQALPVRPRSRGPRASRRACRGSSGRESGEGLLGDEAVVLEPVDEHVLPAGARRGTRAFRPERSRGRARIS